MKSNGNNVFRHPKTFLSKPSLPFGTLFASFISFLLGALIVASIHPCGERNFSQFAAETSYQNPVLNLSDLAEIKYQQIALNSRLEQLLEKKFENTDFQEKHSEIQHTLQGTLDEVQGRLQRVEATMNQLLEANKQQEQLKDFMHLRVEDILKSQDIVPSFHVSTSPSPVTPKRRKKKRKESTTSTSSGSSTTSTVVSTITSTTVLTDAIKEASNSSDDLDEPTARLMGFSSDHNMTASDLKVLLELLQKVR